MDKLYLSTIGKTGNSKTIVIPSDIVDGLGWNRGDRVYFTLADEDQLIIRKLDLDTIRALKKGGVYDDEPVINIK
jgi:antitoxin component of MazEF toxin-antitoxin module